MADAEEAPDSSSKIVADSVSGSKVGSIEMEQVEGLDAAGTVDNGASPNEIEGSGKDEMPGANEGSGKDGVSDADRETGKDGVDSTVPSDPDAADPDDTSK